LIKVHGLSYDFPLAGAMPAANFLDFRGKRGTEAEAQQKSWSDIRPTRVDLFRMRTGVDQLRFKFRLMLWVVEAKPERWRSGVVRAEKVFEGKP
jgi:hypothetical protein